MFICKLNVSLQKFINMFINLIKLYIMYLNDNNDVTLKGWSIFIILKFIMMTFQRFFIKMLF